MPHCGAQTRIRTVHISILPSICSEWRFIWPQRRLWSESPVGIFARAQAAVAPNQASSQPLAVPKPRLSLGRSERGRSLLCDIYSLASLASPIRFPPLMLSDNGGCILFPPSVLAKFRANHNCDSGGVLSPISNTPAPSLSCPPKFAAASPASGDRGCSSTRRHGFSSRSRRTPAPISLKQMTITPRDTKRGIYGNPSPCGRLLRRGSDLEVIVDDSEKLLDVERLRQVIFRACGEKTFNLARGGVGTQHDRRNACSRTAVL